MKIKNNEKATAKTIKRMRAKQTYILQINIQLFFCVLAQINHSTFLSFILPYKAVCMLFFFLLF